VRVTANIVVRREEDPEAVKNRVHERLHRTINPLPSAKYNARGWLFGQPLRVSSVYDAALSEPGVRWVDNVSLMVDEAPNAVTTVTADVFQANTWYVGSENHVFRSQNNGDGWETAVSFGEDEQIRLVRAHSGQAGMVAAVTWIGEEESRVYISKDCGESWENVAKPDWQIEDMTWMQRDNMPVLLLATDKGLYELNNPGPNKNIEPVLVNPNNQAMRFHAVATATNLRGEVSVAVAAQESGGVYLSFQSGRPNTFGIMEGMEGLDVRVLAVQYKGPRAWLWAGTTVIGDEPGKGCFRWELRGPEDPPSGSFT
jgi:hypothetical protein